MPGTRNKLLSGILFFIGWILSPLTWWNDAFINIPLSYLAAAILFYVTHRPFLWLLVGSYWFTNVLGICLMYFSGEYLILRPLDRMKTILLPVVFIIVYSAIMIYLHTHGKLLPLGALFK